MLALKMYTACGAIDELPVLNWVAVLCNLIPSLAPNIDSTWKTFTELHEGDTPPKKLNKDAFLLHR
jgi:hypothetical protein